MKATLLGTCLNVHDPIKVRVFIDGQFKGYFDPNDWNKNSDSGLYKLHEVVGSLEYPKCKVQFNGPHGWYVPAKWMGF